MGTRPFDVVEKEYTEASRRVDKKAIERIINELDQLGTDQAKALSLTAQGDLHAVKGHYAESLSCFNEALSLYEASGDAHGTTSVIGKVGSVYWRQGAYDKALDILERALSMAKAADDTETVATLLGNIGIIFNETSDYSTALEYYQRSLAVYQQLGLLNGQARTLTNIGIVYGEIDDYDLALENMFRALHLFEESDHDAGKANVMGNIGVIYAHLKDYDNAQTWLERAIALATELEMSREQGYYYCALANVMLEAERLDEALAILNDNNSVLLENPTPTTEALGLRGRIHAKRGELAQAKDLLQQALAQTDERGERSNSAELHKALRDVCKDSGDFEGYIEHNELYQSLNEEIKGSTSTRKLTMQEKERELEEERHQRDEERRVEEAARDRERAILYGALPQHVADRLINGETVTDSFPSASVLFLDIAGFTRIASKVPPGHVVHLLEAIFSLCDDVVLEHGLTKVKTIGDSYMAVAGVPVHQEDHVDRMARAATEMQQKLVTMRLKMPEELGDTSWIEEIGEVNARIGIHCGPVVAGVVGKERLQYDVWGDAVNIASRMESSGEPGRVQASDVFVRSLSDTRSWNVETRVAFEIKGKGVMQTYWLESL